MNTSLLFRLEHHVVFLCLRDHGDRPPVAATHHAGDSVYLQRVLAAHPAAVDYGGAKSIGTAWRAARGE